MSADDERFKAQLQLDVEHAKADLQMQVQRAKAELDAHYDHWRLNVQRDTQTQISMFSGIITFAAAALRSIILVNGGAAVAVLAFLGHVWDSNDQAARVASAEVRPAMVAFVIGIVCGCASTAGAYFSQVIFASQRQWIGNTLRAIAVLLGLGGILAFGCGALSTIDAFSRVTGGP